MYLCPRVSDIVGDDVYKLPGLRYEDIDWERGNVELIVKGKKQIMIIVDPETLNLIRLFCKERGIKKGRIFKISRQGVHNAIKKIVKEKGLRPEISAHKFRHAGAVHLLDGIHELVKGKLNLRQLQLQMGHKSLKTTEDYLQYTDEERRLAFGFD